MLEREKQAVASRTRAPEIGVVELMVAMRRLPGAAGLHASELSVLASVARPRQMRQGEALAREGTALHAIFLVLEGEVTVRSRGEVVARARAGDTIGALSALARDPDGLDCEAVGDALVLSISLEDLEDVFEEVPNVLVQLTSHVARRVLALRLLRDGGPKRLQVGPALLPERPLDLVERILHLRGCPVFANVPIDAVAALADVARESRVAAGEPLWRRGAAASALLLVVSGELDVVLDTGTRTTLRPGDLAGEAEVLAGAPRPTEAVARTPLVVFSIEREALLDTWEDHLDLGVELLRDACARLVAAAATMV